MLSREDQRKYREELFRYLDGLGTGPPTFGETELKHSIDQIFNLEDFQDALARNKESRLGKVLLARDQDFLKSLG